MKAASEEEVPARFGGYVRGEELGRGAFARVFACERAGSGERFAAKAFDLRRLRLSVNVGREAKKLQREASILKKVPPHPNLVRFVDVVQEGSWLFFLLELVDGGNLFNALVRRPGRRPRLQEAEARFVFQQLVEGLGHLHDQGIIHRDLKLENVLVVRERAGTSPGGNLLLDVKIADFGLSKGVGDGHSEAFTTVGSPRYMAPEVIAKGTHDFRADLWSLGILVYVLLDGRFPCDKGSDKAQQQKLDAAVARLPAGEHAQAAVLGLLQLNPEARTTIAELQRHPWLTGGPCPGRGATRRAAGAGDAAAPPAKRSRLRKKQAVSRMPPALPPVGASLFGPREEEAVSSAADEVAKALASPRRSRAAASGGRLRRS